MSSARYVKDIRNHTRLVVSYKTNKTCTCILKFLALIDLLCDQFSGSSVLATPAIPFPYQLFSAVCLIYSMSRLEAHQTAVLRKFKQCSGSGLKVKTVVSPYYIMMNEGVSVSLTGSFLLHFLHLPTWRPRKAIEKKSRLGEDI